MLGDYVQGMTEPGLLRFYDMLTVGAMSRGSVFALGILPYVSARIYVRLAQRFWNPERRVLTRVTRGLTVGLALVQSYGYALFTQSVPGVVAQPGAGYLLQTTAVLTAASVFAMWLCENVTAEDVVRVPPKVKRSVLPEISGGYDAMYAQLRAARQKQAV